MMKSHTTAFHTTAFHTTATNNDLLSAIREYIYSISYDQGVDIQLFLCLIAVAVAFFLSMLIGRIVKRKVQNNARYGHLINSMVASMLLPFMVILSLVSAGWISAFIIPMPPTHTIILSSTKIAFAWLVSSTLLLLAQRHFIAYLVGAVILIMTLLNVSGLLLPAQSTLNAIAIDTEKLHISLLDVIKGLFTLVILFWGAGVLSKISENWLRRSSLSFNARELAIKFLRIFLYFSAFIFTLTEMGVDLTVLTVFGATIAVGLGFGLQKITSNILSGLVLLFEKAIEAGDLIEIGNEKGWVREMAIRHTLLETFDGREILIPNEELIIGRVTNWTYTNTRARIDISLTITFGSDVDLARKLLIEAAKGHRLCISEPPPAAQLRDFVDRGIQMLLVFWIPDVTQGMSTVKSDVMLQIINSFRQAGIRFAEIK